jgi:predicted nucleic acid-binding protein
MILDSNIVIEATGPNADDLITVLGTAHRFVSSITRVEVLGFHRLREEDRRDIETFLLATTEILPTSEIIEQAIALRQSRKMGLGDALIAATALVHGLTLVTRNVKDFRWINGLDLLDPSTIGPPKDEGSAAGA